MHNQTQLPVPHDRCHNLNFMNISHHSCVSPFLSLHPTPLILPALPQELEAAIKTIVIWLKSADAALDQHTSYTGTLHHASCPIMPPWPLPSPSPWLPSLPSLDTTTLPVVTMVHPPPNTLANELEKTWAWPIWPKTFSPPMLSPSLAPTALFIATKRAAQCSSLFERWWLQMLWHGVANWKALVLLAAKDCSEVQPEV